MYSRRRPYHLVLKMPKFRHQVNSQARSNYVLILVYQMTCCSLPAGWSTVVHSATAVFAPFPSLRFLVVRPWKALFRAHDAS